MNLKFSPGSKLTSNQFIIAWAKLLWSNKCKYLKATWVNMFSLVLLAVGLCTVVGFLVFSFVGIDNPQQFTPWLQLVQIFALVLIFLLLLLTTVVAAQIHIRVVKLTCEQLDVEIKGSGAKMLTAVVGFQMIGFLIGFVYQIPSFLINLSEVLDSNDLVGILVLCACCGLIITYPLLIWLTFKIYHTTNFAIIEGQGFWSSLKSSFEFMKGKLVRTFVMQLVAGLAVYPVLIVIGVLVVIFFAIGLMLATISPLFFIIPVIAAVIGFIFYMITIQVIIASMSCSLYLAETDQFKV